jgi:acyl dehydratase
MLNYPVVKNYEIGPVPHTYTARDTMLYALGVGCAAADRIEPDDLRFIYEKELVALPSMATVLAQPGFWAADPRTGIDWHHMLHTEQYLKIYKPLPPAGSVIGQMRVIDVYDRGADKGALLVAHNEIRDAATGEPLAMSGFGALLRRNGGFGGSTEGMPVPHPTPTATPDLTLDLPTRPEQAFIYRLSGDYNPLHVDHDVARIAGFQQPILHGLCSYGVATRAVLKLLCCNDPARLRTFNARFASPVYAGETIRTEIWRQGPGVAAVQARVVERDTVVMRNGFVEYG